MARRNGDRRAMRENESKAHRLHPDTKKSIWAITFIGLAAILILAGLGKAGPAGAVLSHVLTTLLGIGYFVLPASFLTVAGVLLATERQRFIGITLLGAGLLILSILGLIELTAPGNGGWLGLFFGSLHLLFGKTAAFVINAFLLAIAVLTTLNIPIKVKRQLKEQKNESAGAVTDLTREQVLPPLVEAQPASAKVIEEGVKEMIPGEKSRGVVLVKSRREPAPKFGNYVPPPLDLLKSGVEKPTTGDLRANANIIKRTLESFGISVEMGEVNIGPTVTRYTLKPAEGVKLSRITALNQDLALALAAHPIRIEAPIPGKSLLGIEVPNKTAALVRLGSLMGYQEFQTSGLLSFALGRDVMGEPLFPDIERMPHLLVAGATGSGKSVAIHSLLVSLLYKNSPETLKLILVDPKRVELTIYEDLPHLISPVITESKKAAYVFRWAISEMERRYDILQSAGSRDIKSYNSGKGEGSPLPYLLVVVDELADLMTSYGREVEGSIVRLAQMSRATGLHLVLSTQRPSVEVLTGLIKANITSRIALQVASQVDSRTILDSAGAEKLLGGGDLLFTSPELSKPKRIQGAYISEDETQRVADFICTHNKAVPLTAAGLSAGGLRLQGSGSRSRFAYGGENGEQPFSEEYDLGDSAASDDELYTEAVRVIAGAKKASASLLQRRLKVGYARAARLLDMMEERGVVGPGDGAKPREVYLDTIREE